ncbi:MAG: site-2 protease family protein [Calditrichae bacterium]|nr:site-2 protease family protein [Calditrichia bacterium]
MKIEKIQEIQQIIGSTFELFHRSRFGNYLVFRVEMHTVSTDQMSDIVGELIKKGYYPSFDQRDEQIYLHVTYEKNTPKKSGVWVNVILFLLTILTTMMAGAVLVGKNYLIEFSDIFYGWKYSLAVLSILTAHEFGHYFAAQYHKIKATLPYYIPLPIPGIHFGTLGAFIKMKSPLQSRIALLDVGAAGPLAGFVVSIFILILGYWQLPDKQGITQIIDAIHPPDVEGEVLNLVLGKSLLFSFFNDIIGGGRLPMNEIYHFPLIFSGWIGLLVTAINLIPIGQLDGGHILYALVQKKARILGILAFALLLILNFVLIVQYLSFIWVLWIILIFVLIGFRHPPTVDDKLELTSRRMATGWICLLLFILCFPPLPLYIN